MRNPASNQIMPVTATTPKVLSSSKESLKSQKKGENFLSCHICSRPFAAASLPIHIPQCLQKWKLEQSKLPKSKRATIEPVRDARMDTMTPEEWNKVAEENSRVAMPACSHCNRKFSIDRIAKHESVCTMNKSKGSSSVTVGLDGGASAKKQAHQTSQRAQAHDAVMNSSGPSINTYDMKIVDPAKNPMRVCAICTREFGSKSIGLHIPQCAKKFVLEQERLHMPRSQRKTMDELITAAKNSLAARPATAVAVVNPHDEILLKGAPDGIGVGAVQIEVAPTIDFRTPCPNCSRKFNPDRLPVHLKSCKPK